MHNHTMSAAARRPVTMLDPNLRTRIADFLIDYVHTIDDDRLEDWPGYFTDDALYHITTRESEEQGLPIGIMHCLGRGMLEDRIKALRTANIFEPHTYCHLLGPSRLERECGDLIAARTNFSVARTMQNGKTELFLTGCYQDKICLINEELALQSRKVILESRRVDVLLVIPV